MSVAGSSRPSDSYPDARRAGDRCSVTAGPRGSTDDAGTGGEVRPSSSLFAASSRQRARPAASARSTLRLQPAPGVTAIDHRGQAAALRRGRRRWSGPGWAGPPAQAGVAVRRPPGGSAGSGIGGRATTLRPQPVDRRGPPCSDPYIWNRPAERPVNGPKAQAMPGARRQAAAETRCDKDMVCNLPQQPEGLSKPTVVRIASLRRITPSARGRCRRRVAIGRRSHTAPI